MPEPTGAAWWSLLSAAIALPLSVASIALAGFTRHVHRAIAFQAAGGLLAVISMAALIATASVLIAWIFGGAVILILSLVLRWAQ
jgi:hypothetical protein